MYMESIFIKRTLAFIIDALIITAIMWILSALVYPLIIVTGIFPIFNVWLILLAFIIIVYFSYMEKNKGATLGKDVMKLRVVSLEGELTYKKAVTRNLSKILWFPIIFDLIAGSLSTGNYLRYLDKVANTDVEVHAVE
ncbi:MAG: RDD family protein [Methanobacteriaceae archaeon]|nr:MAG: RDD family protein [Methanobacterium sp. BRmetb2]MCC7557105.1 RDD family protein [Methanobacteriaceae archaeon]